MTTTSQVTALAARVRDEFNNRLNGLTFERVTAAEYAALEAGAGPDADTVYLLFDEA